MASKSNPVRQFVASAADTIRTELWPIPTLGILIALLAAIGLTQVDSVVDGSLPAFFRTIVFDGDAGAARSVLSSVATALMTVTSLTFSLTVVTLQLASGQFSPRLLRTFTRDRFVQIVLAIFLGTFTFSLTVLRSIRSSNNSNVADFVPRISVTVTYLLTIAAVVGLVLFLAHLAEEIRVETMMRTVHAEASSTVQNVLTGSETANRHLDRPDGEVTTILAARSGFITGVFFSQLTDAAERNHAVIMIEVSVGSSVVEGTPIGSAWTDHAGAPKSRALTEEAAEAMQGAADRGIRISFERTSLDDISYGLRQLTDIAAKALSPGINDPTTATHTLGHSSALVCSLARLPLGDELLRDGDDQLRVILRRPDLVDLLELAVDQPRRYGASEPQVVQRLFQLLREVAWVTSRPEHRSAVRDELHRTDVALANTDVDDVLRERYAVWHGEVEAALSDRW